MHPSEYYVRYLLARAYGSEEQETVDTINYALAAFGLPKMTPEAFDHLEVTFRLPKVFNFHNRLHMPTVQFMREEKIYGMWKPRPEQRAVFDLLRKPQVKETIQVLLMGRFTSEEIAPRVEKKFGTKIHPMTIDTHRHYFWNVARASSEEWMHFLYESPMRDHYLAALWGSKNQALYRAGFSPKIEGKQALKEAHRALSMRIEATRIMPDNQETTRMLTSMSKELVTIHNALYGEGAGLEEAMHEMRKFRMSRKAPNVIDIRSLAPKGNFSNSGS